MYIILIVCRLNLQTGEQTVLSTHGAPVKSVAYSKEHCRLSQLLLKAILIHTALLISASWDSTLHIHTLDSPSSKYTTIPLPAKPHSLSISTSKLVVAMASRLFHIYDLQPTVSLISQSNGAVQTFEPWQKRESSLKFMTRAIACMPNDAGYATSSIEGRVAVEWFDPSPDSQSRKYAFKCHRQPAPENDGTDIVYPVNALAFHPIHGSFASGGGDGVVALWDAVGKRRMKLFQRYSLSVAALDFSSDGKYLAVAVCPGFEDGQEDYSGEGQTKVFVRELAETDAKGKGPK